MARSDLPLPQLELPALRGFGETTRRDAWWLQPAVVFTVFTAFVIYATWAAFQAKNYFYDGGGAHYLSPFYSPLLFGQENEPRIFNASVPSWWPALLPFSPALLILGVPVGFRFTCYYYRGAYYKAFWGDPVNCAVGEPSMRGTRYRGERWLPLVLQNAHRYFLYLAVIFVAILAWDGIRAFFFHVDGGTRFGVGVGSVVLLLNALFLGMYTFGCHCARHIVGGHHDEHSKAPIRHACWNCVSALNRRHMFWAWVSLFWVGWSDIYVRLCCAGVFTDFHVIF